RRRRPEQDCVQEFRASLQGEELWLPVPRVALCARTLTSFSLSRLLGGSNEWAVHAVYFCEANLGEIEVSSMDLFDSGLFTALGAGCEASEHELLAQVLLREREASTVLVLPPAATSTQEAPSIASLVACAMEEGSSGFCDRQGWRAVTVAALVCFSSDGDEGMQQIYRCRAHPSDPWMANQS
ncbi:unnamed protein product, partial [Polarella glacialis]